MMENSIFIKLKMIDMDTKELLPEINIKISGVKIIILF